MLERVFAGKGGRIEPYALSNCHGRAAMRLPYRANGGAEFGRSTIEPANRLAHHKVDHSIEVEIETRTLDEYDLHNVGFVKIDVEGHELAVLAGAEHTVTSSRPNMLVECNDDHQPNGAAKLAQWLADHDYTGHFALGKALLPIERYVHAEHWQRHGIENFICIHKSRSEVREAVASRVARFTSP
jgi:FkbM family methyltransferase